MRLLLFALHAAAPRPRTLLRATTNHYELNQELSRARAPDELLQVVESRAPDFNAVNAATAQLRAQMEAKGQQQRHQYPDNGRQQAHPYESGGGGGICKGADIVRCTRLRSKAVVASSELSGEVVTRDTSMAGDGS